MDFGGPLQDLLAMALMAGLVMLGGFLILLAGAWLITWSISAWDRLVAKITHEPPVKRW